MSRRGDVVLITIPYYTGSGSENRPVVVVQCDRKNLRLASTIVAGITTNLRHVRQEPTQLLIDPGTPEGQSSRLRQPSAVKCENLFTVAKQDIEQTLGHLSDSLLQKLDECLKAALELP